MVGFTFRSPPRNAGRTICSYQITLRHIHQPHTSLFPIRFSIPIPTGITSRFNIASELHPTPRDAGRGEQNPRVPHKRCCYAVDEITFKFAAAKLIRPRRTQNIPAITMHTAARTAASITIPTCAATLTAATDTSTNPANMSCR